MVICLQMGKTYTAKTSLGDFKVVDDHFWKPNRKKKPNNMDRKELVSGQEKTIKPKRQE